MAMLQDRSVTNSTGNPQAKRPAPLDIVLMSRCRVSRSVDRTPLLPANLYDSGMKLRQHQDCETLTSLVLDYFARNPGVAKVEKAKKGTLLWHAGDGSHPLFLLQRGQVAITLSGASGSEVILRLVQPGETFGELCFCSLRDQPRPDYAVATSSSEALRLDYAGFIEFLRQDVKALERFTFVLCEKLADAERRVHVLAHRDAVGRLVRLLVQLAEAQNRGRRVSEADVRIPVGHEQIAQMAAMTRPHVSVTMAKLRSKGLISYGRSQLLTVNLPRLIEFLEESAGLSSLQSSRAMTGQGL